MRPSARIKAAIDVLDDIVKRHRPASAALADWGKSNRYAGSGDRSAIGTLIDRFRGAQPAETYDEPPQTAPGRLGGEEIRKLQSILFELLECKRLLDQVR